MKGCMNYILLRVIVQKIKPSLLAAKHSTNQEILLPEKCHGKFYSFMKLIPKVREQKDSLAAPPLIMSMIREKLHSILPTTIPAKSEETFIVPLPCCKIISSVSTAGVI